MSLLWAIPPVAVAAAMVITLLQLRNLAEASEDLSLQLRRLDEVRVAVAETRSAAADVRASLRRVRAR